MKKVLVFGGAGYCGSLLVPQLLSEGWEVTVYDTMWYGTDQFLKNERLNLIQGDVRDLKKVQQACAGQDSVLHLACISALCLFGA